MTLTFEQDLHYHCSFTLTPVDSGKTPWNDIVEIVRNWVSSRLRERDVQLGKWFFIGGEWKAQRALVKTERAIGRGSDDSPEYWAMRWEHPDSSVPARQWKTDIGVTRLLHDRYLFALSTIHWLLPGFLGREPDSPVPSAPAVISMLLNSKQWIGSSGSERLVTTPILVREGMANEFVDRLMAPDRGCSIVLISRDPSTGKPLLDASRLARLMAGAASVFEAESSLIDLELEHLLDAGYRCSNGMARGYQPGVRRGDSKRHRYFTKREIEALGTLAVEGFFVAGIVKRSRLNLGAGVATIDDVLSKQRETRLAELRAQAQESQDYTHLLEAETEELSNKLVKKEEELSYWIAQVEEQQGLGDEVRRMQYEKKILEEQASETQQRFDILAEQASVVHDLEELPNSVSDVIDLVERLFPERIVFTERARKSAREARLKNHNVAWRCLRAMARELYELHFGEKLPLREIANRFRDSTGFELAIGESEMTKGNKRLAALRKDVYKGHSIDIGPHIKYGRDPGNSLRVHYYAHPQDRLIVVGHCGDHLDTSRTN